MLSMLSDNVSNSQHDSLSLCSWQMMEPENKRLKTEKEVNTRLQDVSDPVEPMQLQNIARLASLEAIRFRDHNIDTLGEGTSCASFWTTNAIDDITSVVCVSQGRAD